MKEGPASGLNLSVSFSGWLDRRFFSRTARHLEKLLKRTPSTVTLRVELANEAAISYLNRLLRRLAPYGDRIFIHFDNRLRELVRIDSSVFSFDAGLRSRAEWKRPRVALRVTGSRVQVAIAGVKSPERASRALPRDRQACGPRVLASGSGRGHAGCSRGR